MSASDLAQVLSFSPNEAELVSELQAGSNAAFDTLVTHYHTAVYNLVYRMLGDASDAADVCQEVFLKAFRGIRGFRRGSSVRTWLYRIAVREALNHRRWWWRHQRNQTSIDTGAAGDALPLDPEADDASPFEAFAAQETQALVRQALTQVPEAFRSAVILRDLEGLSYEEVAEVLEVTVGTVKSRILRGRRALREILAPLIAGSRETVPACTTDDGAVRERGGELPARSQTLNLNWRHMSWEDATGGGGRR
jgi:RNA polymerase sigma-70 factor, ECF subfamily